MTCKILSKTTQVRMKLEAYWAKQQPGKVISVRMLFQFGPEAFVYLIMSELVKIGKLVRPAWGLYMIPNSDRSSPSVQEIADAKAEGFGKKILRLNKEFQNSIRVITKTGEATVAFASSGCTTRFRYEGKNICFFKVADRKFDLLKSKVGAAFATLWKTQADRKPAIKRIFKVLKVDRLELRAGKNSLHLLPKWLKDVLRIHYPEISGPQ